jgi:hypothetical protein
MYKLRLWLGVFIFWLFLFYNIERINEPINISSFVYLLVPIAGMVPPLIPNLQRRVGNLIYTLLVLGAFFILKTSLGYQILGEQLPITVMEILIILISLFLFRKVSDTVWNFENTIANITFQQIGLPPRIYETTDTEDLYREVKRSRRFRRPLTLVVAKPVFDPSEGKINEILKEFEITMISRYVQARIAKLFSDELSDSDLIVVENDQFTILMPETIEEEALKRMHWLQEEAKKRLNIDLFVGSAEFPKQAVTLHGLIDNAVEDVEEKENKLITEEKK